MKRLFSQLKRRPGGYLVIFGVLLIVIALVSVCLGQYPVPLGELLKLLLSKIFSIEPTWTGTMEKVIFNIRLPRVALAILVGCCLSAAGATYQGVFLNPMAAPDILGATAGAAFGAALAIFLGLQSAGITAFAFVFGLISVGLVFLVGRLAPGKQVTNLILSGIMIGSLFSSGTSFIKLVADTQNQLPQITYWLMGSLASAKNDEVIFALIPMALGLIPLLLLRWRINLLTLGDEQARSMGVNTTALRLVVIIAATLITAASVSVSGMIGWVGLVIPHLCRRIVGNDFKYLLPASMLVGGTFLLVVDDVSRLLLTTQIPIGILTAFIGVPFFLWLILRKEKAA